MPPQSMNAEFWSADLFGSISRLSSEFCNLIQGPSSDHGCRLLALSGHSEMHGRMSAFGGKADLIMTGCDFPF
jgi:hypothetical protein